MSLTWLGVPLYFGPTILYSLAKKPWSAENQRFYNWLTHHSSWFPSGPKRQWIFPFVWTFFLWVGMPMAGKSFALPSSSSPHLTFAVHIGYFFWQDFELASTYSLGLAFYWFTVAFVIGWFNLFFELRWLRLTFWFTLIALDGCALGAFICFIIAGAPLSAVFFGLLGAVWLPVATIWTCIAAYWVPEYKEKTDNNTTANMDTPQPQQQGFSLTNDQNAQQQQQQFPLGLTDMPDRNDSQMPIHDQMKQVQSMIQNYGQQQQQQQLLQQQHQQQPFMMPFNGFRPGALSIGSSVVPFSTHQQQQQQQQLSVRGSAGGGVAFSVTSQLPPSKTTGKLQLRVPDIVK